LRRTSPYLQILNNDIFFYLDSEYYIILIFFFLLEDRQQKLHNSNEIRFFSINHKNKKLE